MSAKIELSVVALAVSESQPNAYTLVLEDVEQKRRVPILIGQPEAQAIAIAMEKLQPLRPLTHDLLKQIVEVLGATLLEVFIHALHGDAFEAQLHLRTQIGDIVQLSARPSDAIALAVRFDAPIYTLDSIIEDAGVQVADFGIRTKKGSLAEYSLAELEELLQKLVEKEDYKSAVRIRDYLERRRKS